MTKVTGGMCLPWASERKNVVGDQGGTPVALRETEPILRDFLNVMGELQEDLAGRWAAMRERPVFSRAE
ncbi:hypothetical protein [Streptomyces flaveolus]|jgi:hypothetical protein|uniref:hypothetical protein n=1 Tax=Streptomyces flaveolus TaxID=67297 RepID=UPI00166FA015|nr:hypothetical protein [Streptomyces flaveolus]GGQ68552.1 hypothetical protein GCM10010216_33020 [Streptomyces flaveolus]